MIANVGSLGLQLLLWGTIAYILIAILRDRAGNP